MSPILSDLDRHAAMDDVAEWSGTNRCSADACSQGRNPCPCPEACRVAPRERLGRFHGWERVLIEHPTAVAVLSVIAFGLLIWGTKP